MMTSSTVIKPVLQVPPVACLIDRVLLMESCPVTLAGIRSLLSSPRFHVKYAVDATMANRLFSLTLQYPTDLVILELCGHGESVMDGLRAIKLLRYRWPSMPIVVSTALMNTELFKQLILLKVNCIYFKRDPLSALSTCIMRAMEGQYCYSPRVSELTHAGISRSEILTEREMDVLECLMNGKSVTAVATILQRDIRTVSTHKRNAMRKLGFCSDYELYTHGNWLFQNGLSA